MAKHNPVPGAAFDMWYREVYSPGAALALKVRNVLHHEKSPFQDIHVMETYDYGRMMTLDGCVMVTDRDEMVYHEMITHIPMCTHPKPQRVLVIGGGDGGTVREILRHPSVKQVDLVEIDEAVIRVSREFFPKVASKLDDPKVKIHCVDGVAFVKDHKDTYDVIMVDSTDFFGMAAGLASVNFYQAIHRALKADGIMVTQSEDAWYLSKPMKRLYGNLAKGFKGTVYGYCASIPTYVSGLWTFALASKKYHPIKNFDKPRSKRIAKETFYYNHNIHRGAFAVPNFVHKAMGKAGTTDLHVKESRVTGQS